MEPSIRLPQAVSAIISKLEASGYEAYAVGGCVRDSLMNKTPSDWDICTDALPEETLRVLQKDNIIENGMKHGTVTVRYDGNNYEITTFRTEGAYLDNRHPSEVTFVRDLREDLSRRDLTINAMAYREKDGLSDPFGGQQDLVARLIRCVGDPDKRFQEDALRILRALRFASRLGFSIDPETAAAIHRNAPLLKNISSERIMSEFLQLLTGPYVEQILNDYHDVLSVFIPEIKPMLGFRQRNPHHVYDIWQHTVKVTAAIDPDPILRLTAFFHDIGKPACFTMDAKSVGHFHGHPDVGAAMTQDILKRLKNDNQTVRTVTMLIKLHDLRPPATPANVRKFVARTGTDWFPALLELKRADAKGQNPLMLSLKLRYIDELEGIYYNELANHAVFSLKQLAVNGSDLQQLGIQKGERIGETLRQLLALVIEDELPNDRERLLKEAGRLNEYF